MWHMGKKQHHHGKRNTILIASSVALIVAGSWIGMKMRHHNKFSEEETC